MRKFFLLDVLPLIIAVGLFTGVVFILIWIASFDNNNRKNREDYSAKCFREFGEIYTTGRIAICRDPVHKRVIFEEKW